MNLGKTLVLLSLLFGAAVSEIQHDDHLPRKLAQTVRALLASPKQMTTCILAGGDACPEGSYGPCTSSRKEKACLVGAYTKCPAPGIVNAAINVKGKTVGACAVACVLSPWGEWSNCTKSCGGGEQNTTRTVVTPPKNGGSCGSLTKTRACNEQACDGGGADVNCVVSNWTEWSACNTTCGAGMQTATRNVTTQPAGNGTACPELIKTQACTMPACNGTAVNCVVSNWTEWSACNATCGNGTQTSTRNITTPASNGGTACPTDLTRTQACTMDPCPSPPVNCVVSNWTEWSACNATCGTGTQTSTRNITTPASNGGTACPTDLTKTQACTMDPCPGPAVNCVMSDWSAWGECTKTCGTGSQTANRTVVTPASNGGTACPTDLTKTQDCNTAACPVAVNCVMSDWSAWGECTKACGTGSQTANRTVVTPASNGGTACPTDLTKTQDCNTAACPVAVNCVMSAWTWGVCDKACGTGSQTGTRTVVTPASNGGTACPTDLTSTQPCNTDPCATTTPTPAPTPGNSGNAPGKNNGNGNGKKP